MLIDYVTSHNNEVKHTGAAPQGKQGAKTTDDPAWFAKKIKGPNVSPQAELDGHFSFSQKMENMWKGASRILCESFLLMMGKIKDPSPEAQVVVAGTMLTAATGGAVIPPALAIAGLG